MVASSLGPYLEASMSVSAIAEMRSIAPTSAAMTRRIIIAATLAAILGGGAGWAARGFLAVDACLDAGGRWEARGGYCDGAHRAVG